MVVMATSFKRIHANMPHGSQDYCIQCPWPCSRPLSVQSSARYCWTLKASLALSLVASLFLSSGSWYTQDFVCAFWASLVNMGFDSTRDFAPPTILLGLLLWPWMSFFGGIQHSPVDGCLAASGNFGVLAGKDEHTCFYSTIFWQDHFMANRWRNSGNSDRLSFSWAPKSLQMATAAMKFKDVCSLEEKLWQT